ncbi:MAG: V-type ATP synthase subunit I, partial [Spirochaetota bacterium]
MIVKMKKASLVIMEDYRETALDALREIGVLHIEKKSGTSEDLSTLIEQRTAQEKAILLLPKNENSVTEGPKRSMPEVTSKVLALFEESKAIQDDLEKLRKEQEKLQVWGDFNPIDIEKLKEKGITVRLYNTTVEDFENLPKDIYTVIFSRTKYNVQFASVFLPGTIIPDIKELPLPEQGLTEIAKIISEKQHRREEIDTQMEALSQYREAMKAYITRLDEKIEFEEAKISTEKEAELAFLTGYIPEKKVQLLKETAVRKGWALLIQEPGDDDTVPTLIENPKAIRIIKPIFDFLATVPGYKEFDISFWFLIFFTVFVAMIIGDAGYGFIFLIIAVVAKIKMSKSQPSEPITLLIVLSLATIIWGAITGTWFGSEALSELWLFSWMIFEPVASFNKNSSNLIKQICFYLGVVHLSIAHIKSFIKLMPSLKAVAQVGWLVMIWGLFFLIMNIVLSKPLNPVAPYLIFSGFAAIIVFSEQEGNFFKGLLKGLAGLLLKVLNSVSAFADIISYVRLFAVGLATVEIAKSFNTMVSGLGSSIFGIIAAAIILVLGHGLNIAMSTLSVVVHGIRLNMLEFSGHLGMEWTGVPYKPFQSKTST